MQVQVTFSPAAITNYGGTLTVNSDESSGVGSIPVSCFGVIGDLILTVLTSCSGTISPNLNDKPLTLNKAYTIKAVPGIGYVFSNWTGSITSTLNPLTFTIQSNMLLEAAFVTNPFVAAAGVYEGLCLNAGNVTPASSGFFKATVTSKGAFSASLLLAGRSHSFSGQFSAAGVASNTVTIAASDVLKVLLQLDLTGSNELTGTVNSSTWSSGLLAWQGKLYPLSEPEKYTVVIPGNLDSSTGPAGDGFGLLTVNTQGTATFSGLLADNTTVTETASVSADGQWPFYASLYSGNGLIIGWLSLTNEIDRDIDGTLTWIKGQSKEGVKFYPAGFTNQPQAVGSLYDYTSGLPILNITSRVFYLTGGNLADGLTDDITLTGTKAASADKTLKLTFTTSTGRFQGTVANPVSGELPKTLSFKGAVLQKQNVALGFFAGTNQYGLAGIGSNAPTELMAPRRKTGGPAK